MKACAFTGHRPKRFSFKYDESDPLCIKIKEALYEQAKKMYLYNEVRKFYSGGALGVDIWAAETVLKLKHKDGFSDIELIIAIPFRGYADNWSIDHQLRLADIVDNSTLYIVSPNSTDAFKKRNYYMITCSDYLIAVYDYSQNNIRSGTAQTVNRAKLKHLPITYIHPDTALITVE